MGTGNLVMNGPRNVLRAKTRVCTLSRSCAEAWKSVLFTTPHGVTPNAVVGVTKQSLRQATRSCCLCFNITRVIHRNYFCPRRQMAQKFSQTHIHCSQILYCSVGFIDKIRLILAYSTFAQTQRVQLFHSSRNIIHSPTHILPSFLHCH